MKMNIKVSKVFARFINKTAKEMGFEAEAEVVTVSKNNYSFIVGDDIFSAVIYGDYDYACGVVKAIIVRYPDGYYACPKYLTTKLLIEEVKRRGVKDLEGLKDMLRDLLEI